MFKEKVLELKAAMQKDLDALILKKVELEANMALIDETLKAYEADLVAEYNLGWDEAMIKSGQAASPDAKYTEAELNAELEAAKAPLLVEVADLKVMVSNLQSQVEVLTQELQLVPAKIEAAVEQKQAEMVADFEQVQVDDAAFLAKYKK